MRFKKDKILEKLLRGKNGVDVPLTNLPKYKLALELLHTDLEIFAGGQKADRVTEYEIDSKDTDGTQRAWSNFRLPSGRERWFQLYSIYSQQKTSRSSTLLTYVLVGATFIMAAAAVVQACCTYETMKAASDQRVVVIK